MLNKLPVSVVIITWNVESNIKECLESVAWAQEIVIVDNGSTDKTLEIARLYTKSIYPDTWDKEGSIRNRAYQRAKNEWVLSLDPDERVSETLRNQIEEVLKNGTEYDAFSVAMKSIFGRNYWMRYGGWYPAGRVKFFKKSKFRYEDAEIHPRAYLDGKEGRLSGDIAHYCYDDFSQVVSKMNLQSTLEAQKWVRDKRKMNAGVAAVRTFSRFFKMYVQKKGYKDGVIGFMMAWQWATYQLLSYVKYWCLKKMEINTEKQSKQEKSAV
ncbi:MAG: glycosyltransferase family 2 protein [Candidatus Omnitrophica bacterium]|nr:glycosyltransferase family 2 protein [Candidatus Omnitrophota bacterium]MBU4477918.1 glycosyltransferase family 2 protein [Candidatus Omnitrophota bacterium]